MDVGNGVGVARERRIAEPWFEGRPGVDELNVRGFAVSLGCGGGFPGYEDGGRVVR